MAQSLLQRRDVFFVHAGGRSNMLRLLLPSQASQCRQCAVQRCPALNSSSRSPRLLQQKCASLKRRRSAVRLRQASLLGLVVRVRRDKKEGDALWRCVRRTGSGRLDLQRSTPHIKCRLVKSSSQPLPPTTARLPTPLLRGAHGLVVMQQPKGTLDRNALGSRKGGGALLHLRTPRAGQG